MKKMSQFVLLSTLFLSIGVSNSPTLVHAENNSTPAPSIQAANATNKNKKILFDNTHAQTAGAADWVIDGGFSDYANALAQDGFYVKELRKATPITLEDLKSYNVFVIPEANIPYKESEQKAISDYVEQGGAVFYIADHYNADRNKNRWDASEVFNGYRRGAYNDPTKGMTAEEKNSSAMQGVVSSDWLANTFGVRFRYNALDNVEHAGNQLLDNTFGLLDGVSSVALHAGSTLAITNPSVAKGLVYLPSGLTSANKWSHAVDQGVYNGGGIAEGAYVAIAKKGLGKAAFIGDSSAVEDASPKYKNEETGAKKNTYNGFSEASDKTLLLNLANWLSQNESYKTFTEKNISLSSKTILAANEAPEKSTEPQSEPWSTSKASYKWWDPTTFAYGSYGYGTTGATSDSSSSNTSSSSDSSTSSSDTSSPTAPINTAKSYQLNWPEKITSQKATTVTIQLTGFNPNTTLTNFDIGVYDQTGVQVGFVQSENGTWPTSAGYSQKFSLRTDSTGSCTKQLSLRVDKSGNHAIRLRQNSKALVTNKQFIVE